MIKHGKKFSARCVSALACGLAFSGALAIVSATPAAAQDNEEESSGNTRRSATLDPAVGRVVAPIFENEIANEEWDGCITKLNQLIAQRGSRFKPYDTAIVNQLLGQCQAGKEDFRGALRSFQKAVDSGGLPPEQVGGLRYVIAQLYFQLEDYNAAIRSLQQWINSGGTPDANAYYLLAAAYTQISPPNFRAATSPAEQAVRLRETPKKADFDLLNLIYSETNQSTKRAALLERMINLFPGEAGYWRQLSGLYNQLKRDKEAFSVLEVAYRAGLLDKESEILTLVQYYSFFDNPFRGAKMLEREMNANVVKRNVKNLKLLSQLWSQSREHKRAIPVLEEAARLSDDGELFYRLGQVLLADEQYAKSEQALASARRKGGLTQRQLADSWMLTGTARFSRAGPGDRAQRNRARTAFQNATRYSTTASKARDWVTYINAINSTEDAQDRLACDQAREEREADIERLTSQQRVCDLRSDESEECRQVAERLRIAQTEEPDACKKIAKPSTSAADSDDEGAEGGVNTETPDNVDGAAPAAPDAAPAEGEAEEGATVKPESPSGGAEQ